MGVVERWSAAFESFEDPAVARDFLRRALPPNDVDSLVQSFREHCRSNGGAGPSRTVPNSLEQQRRRVLARTRALKTQVVRLHRDLLPLWAKIPSELPSISDFRRDPDAWKRAALDAQQRSFAFGLSLGIPADLVFAEGAIPHWIETLAGVDELLSRFSKKTAAPKRTRKKDDPGLTAWVACMLVHYKLTPKVLAAIESLALSRYPRSQSGAAGICKKWENVLSRARPRTRRYLAHVATLPRSAPQSGG